MRFFDTLTNIITGMGTAKSKSFATSYTFMPMGPQELDAAYRGSWIARKVIDIPALDMCREWRSWQAENAEIEAIEEEERRLNVRGKVLEAKIRARLYGGAAILIGDGASNPAEELVPSTIKRGGLRYLPVISVQRITANEIETDISSPWFGAPSSYTITTNQAAQLRIHPSRIVRLLGAPVLDDMTAATAGWGDSILEAVGKALKDAESVAANVADLTHEAKIDILGVENLMAMASDPRYEERFLKRASTASLAKGLHNTLIRDSKETWEQKQISFATLPDVMDRFLQIAAGAADIPVTRLLGQSPAGMNATGESDEKNYFNRIRSMQELELRPALSILDECLIWSALGKRPKEVHYQWSPLWQMSEKDRADVGLKRAQAFQIHAGSGLMPDSALAKGLVNQLVEESVYPGLEAAMDEAEAEGDAIDFGEKANEPEVPIIPSPVTRMQAAANDAAVQELEDLIVRTRREIDALTDGGDKGADV